MPFFPQPALPAPKRRPVYADKARGILSAAIAYDRMLDEEGAVAGYDDYLALLAFVEDAAEELRLSTMRAA